MHKDKDQMSEKAGRMICIAQDFIMPLPNRSRDIILHHKIADNENDI
jgi:hypothetical protein